MTSMAIWLKKGTLARVQGRLKQNVWLDNEGKRHERIILIAENVDFQYQNDKNGKDMVTSEKISNTMEVEIIENEPAVNKKKKN